MGILTEIKAIFSAKYRKIRTHEKYLEWEKSHLPHFLAFHVPAGDFRLFCSKPWFNKKSVHDLKVVACDEKQTVVEVDTLEYLELTQHEPAFEKLNNFIIFQHWGPDRYADDGTPCRLYQTLTKPAAKAVAKILKGGPTKRFIFLCAGFTSGSIRLFADTLGPGQLDMLGLFWYFCGDDITDDLQDSDDVAYAVNHLNLKRISILTGEFNSECEDRLAKGLKDNKTIQYFEIFGKDDKHKYPRFDTPKLDKIMIANRINLI